MHIYTANLIRLYKLILTKKLINSFKGGGAARVSSYINYAGIHIERF